MSMAAGRCTRRRNGEGIPARASPNPTGQKPCSALSGLALRVLWMMAASSEPTGKPLFHPWSSPCSPPDPGKNAKNPAPSPRFAGPAPAASTENPDAFGQCPEGRVRKDDPCLGLRRLPTGGACGSFIIRYRCDIVNTLVRDPAGFFCHFRDSRPAISTSNGGGYRFSRGGPQAGAGSFGLSGRREGAGELVDVGGFIGSVVGGGFARPDAGETGFFQGAPGSGVVGQHRHDHRGGVRAAFP